MRALLLATTSLFIATATQAAPVFRSVTEEPALQLPANAPRVEMPASAPAPTEADAPRISFDDQPQQTTPWQSAPAPTAALPVSRSGEVIDSVGGDAIPAISLEAVTENGITYVNGGVGDEELAQLKANENAFNLRLEIVGSYGQFVSEMTLILKDANGTTLLTVSDAGPYVYFQIPAGSYSAEISGNGTAKALALTIVDGKALKHTVRI